MSPTAEQHLISREINAFIIDRKAKHLSINTIVFYSTELERFRLWLYEQHIEHIEEITNTTLREYLIELATHRNPGGCHGMWRTIKAFFNWYENEIDNPNWRNPIYKVAAPKVNPTPIAGIPMEDFGRMLVICEKTRMGQRDRAILFMLIDTGVRREEIVNINIEDVNFKSGSVVIKHGKGNKSRVVYLGVKGRKELVRYLRYRPAHTEQEPLFLSEKGTRLRPHGLRQILKKRCKDAGISDYSPHDFRRTFAIEYLRNGGDIYTLMALMGHTSPTVLQRYLKIVTIDLQNGHEKYSPGDRVK